MTESKFRELEIPIAKIRDDSAGAHRAIDEAFVAELAESIKRGGLKNRILVNRDGKGWRLRAGRQRIAAFKRLGRDLIPAVELPEGMTEADYRLAEIEENLIRLGLHPVERAVLRADGVDISRWMVQQGQAIAFRKYTLDYVADEDAARAAHRGIWAGEFQDPSDLRHHGHQPSPHETHHACLCPDDVDRVGHRCGGRGVYARSRGLKPVCVGRCDGAARRAATAV